MAHLGFCPDQLGWLVRAPAHAAGALPAAVEGNRDVLCQGQICQLMYDLASPAHNAMAAGLQHAMVSHMLGTGLYYVSECYCVSSCYRAGGCHAFGCILGLSQSLDRSVKVYILALYSGAC